MCSPLAFAVTGMKKSAWVNRLIYNAGRIFTYGVLGAVVSTIGVALPLERFQNSLSVAMGILLIAADILGAGRIKIQAVNNGVAKFTNWLKVLFSNQIQRKGAFSTLLLEALNGLLSCGLTLHSPLALSYPQRLTVFTICCCLEFERCP